MRRMLWLGIGLAVGALVVRAVTKKAQAYTPGGLAASARESASGLIESARSFMEDVRIGMAEREQQIQEAFAEGLALEDDLPGDDGYDFDEKYPQEGTR